jgi:hypothetical protein
MQKNRTVLAFGRLFNRCHSLGAVTDHLAQRKDKDIRLQSSSTVGKCHPCCENATINGYQGKRDSQGRKILYALSQLIQVR